MALPSTLSPAALARAASCPRKTTALTSSCSDVCIEGRPCVAYAGSANLTACTISSALGSCKLDSTGSCAFECFKNSPTDNADRGIIDFSAYTFLIPFGESVSNWETNWSAAEKAAWEAAEDKEADWSAELPSKSNDVVQAIEPLTFLKATKRVTIAGGKSTDGQRGKVAKVALSTQLLSGQTQLEALTLANLQLDQYPQSTFPLQLKNFSMVNCVTKEYPADLPGMTSLQVLDLSKNYFIDYPVKFSLASVTLLNMSINSLASFDGTFPNVETLDLSDNTLTAIPSKIFAMSKLKTLFLSGNAFSNVVLTTTQAQFLQNLTRLSIDSFGVTDATACAAKTKATTVGGAAVCVASGNTTDTTGGGNGGGSNTGAVVGGVIGALAVVAIVAGIFWFYRRRKRAHDANDSAHKGHGGTYTLGGGSTRTGERETVSLWNDQELLSLQVNTDDIEDIRMLGKGAFGVVWLAKYRTTRLVACKRLKKGDATWQNTQAFVAEIKLVAKLEHPRIVALIGVAWTIESDLQALFEFMEAGDLRQYIERPATPRTWTPEKLQIAIDVVEALVYVHSFVPPLVHRDLKSRNVLLSQTSSDTNIDSSNSHNIDSTALRAKLSDFGIARFRSQDNTMTTGVGTGRWLAPEVIAGANDYDQTCDMFAFGVVLSEIDTHALPYEDLVGPNGNRLADVAILQMVASGNLRPTFTQTCPLEIVNIAMRCLALERADRPSAVEVAYALRTLLKANDYYEV